MVRANKTKNTQKPVVEAVEINTAKEETKVETPATETKDGIVYRILEPYTVIPITVLMNHVNGQRLWIPQIIRLLADNKVPSDIVDTTMFSDSDKYDEQKYVSWAARMINESDIAILNINNADGEVAITSLEENLNSGLFENKYVIVRIDPDLSPENIDRIMKFVDPMKNVLATTDDKYLIQSVYAVAKSFN